MKADLDRKAHEESQIAETLVAFVISLFSGVALYLLGFSWRYPRDFSEFIISNALKGSRSVGFEFWAVRTIPLMALIFFLISIWDFRSIAVVPSIRRALHFAVPLCGALVLVSLQPLWIEYNRIYFSLAIVILATSLFSWSLCTAQNGDFLRRLFGSIDTLTASLSIVTILSGLYIGYFSSLSILRYRTFFSSAYDMSWENQAMWHIYDRGYMLSTFSPITNYLKWHTPYIYYFLVPIYSLNPAPETLLIIQSTLVGSGAMAVFLLGRHFINSFALSALLSFFYLLHPSLHGQLLFDFHSPPLAISLFLFSLFFFVTDRNKLGLLFIALASLCREDMPLLSIGIGVWLWLEGKPRLGGGIAVVAIVLFILNTQVVMGYFDGNPDFRRFNLFYGDKPGILPFLLASVLNPFFYLHNLFAEPKVQFLLEMLCPLLFLPLFNPLKRFVLIVPGLLVTIVFPAPPFYSVGFQYNTMLFVALTFLSVTGMGGLKEFLERYKRSDVLRTFFSVSLIFSLVYSRYYGSLPFSKSLKTGTVSRDMDFSYRQIGMMLSYPRETEETRSAQQAVDLIPNDAYVSADSFFHPHLSSRTLIAGLNVPPKDGPEFYVFSDRWTYLPADYTLKLSKLRYHPVFEKNSVHLFQKETPYPIHVPKRTPTIDGGILNGGFESGDYTGWIKTGTAFNYGPIYQDNFAVWAGIGPAEGHIGGFNGDFWVGSAHANNIDGYFAPGFAVGDIKRGTLTSVPFKISKPYLSFKIGGYSSPDTSVNLLVDGATVMSVTPPNKEVLSPVIWNVSQFLDKFGVIRVIDASQAKNISVDDFRLVDAPAAPPVAIKPIVIKETKESNKAAKPLKAKKKR